MYSKIFKPHAQLLKALAHPKRLEIIHLIRDREMPVGDIHTMLDLPQANISQHLMVLRDSNVVLSRRDGKQIYYSISNKKIIKASDLLRSVLVEQHRGSSLSDGLTMKMNDLVPLAHDPVCQMRVSPKTASFHQSYGEKDYYFCASGCMKKFTESPKKYVKQ